MDRNDLQRSEQLNRFWDDQVRGQSSVNPTEVDADLAALIERLQALGEPPAVDTTRERIWRNLQQHPQWGERAMGTGTPPFNVTASLPVTDLPARSHSPASAPHRRGWWPMPHLAWNHMATAALLLLTLVTSIVAFGRLRSTPAERPPLLPALVATPAPAAGDETLFSTILPADQIPTTEPTDFVIWNLLIDPGVRQAIAPSIGASDSGPQLTHVVKGELTLTVDGPVRVYRGDKSETTAEEIDPNIPIALRAGDTAVSAIQWSTEFANLASSPVQVVSIGYWKGTLALPPFDDAGITYIEASDYYPDSPLPAVPVQATLTRVTLPPKGSTAAPPPGSLVIQAGVDEDVSIGENSDGSLRNVSPRPATIFVLTLTPLTADTPASTLSATPQAP